MRFLNPTGFFAALLALPILALYFLRLHRREVTVPSTLLWSVVLADRRANRPWQKLRRNWLLFLQLLVLLALVLALARPALPAPVALRGQVIILLDASASMQAVTDTGGTRFDAALRALRDLAGTLDAGDEVTLLAVGPEPRLLLRGGDAGMLRRALDEASPTDGPADWDAAASLAAGLASGDDVLTLLVTDAAIERPLPALPGDARLVTVGADVPNAGIVAFALRRTPDGLTAFVRVQNTGPALRRELSLFADGVLVERRALELPADGAVALSFPALPTLAWAEARLEGTDRLTLDDHAWVAISGGEGGSVLLVTPGNRFLAQSLRSLPGVSLVQATESLPEEPSSYGLMVADGPFTGTWPTTNLWLIAPDATNLCGEPGDVFTPTSTTRGQWSHPLLQYVDWSDVHVARARHYTPPADAEVLLETAGGPLLWVLERPGQRVACLAFDLHDSDLPLRLAFPVLTANLVGWLLPQASAEPVQPRSAGQAWEPPLPPEATGATLVAPDGGRVALPGPVSTRAGLYRLETETATGSSTRYVALSLLDEAESDLRPRPLTSGGSLLPVAGETAASGWRDFSHWPLALALALLLIEAALWWGPSLRHRETTGGFPYIGKPRKVSPTSGNHGGFPYIGKPRRVSPTSGNHGGWSLGNHGGFPVLLRAFLFLCLILALLGARWTRRTRDLAVVFLLDRSASTQTVWENEVAFVETSLATKGARDRVALVIFGGDAWVDRALSVAPDLDAIATFPRAEATDIEEAVRLGLALIPEGAPARLVLLTDGLETAGRAERALREARARGVELLLVQQGAGLTGPEVWLEQLRLPTQVYPGDRVPVAVTVGADHTGPVQLTWAVGAQSGHESLEVNTTQSTHLFSFMAEEPGFTSLSVCLGAEADTFPQNNCARGWVIVQGPPRLLLVGAPEEREPLAAALRQAGLTVEETTPGALSLTAQGLADYAVVVLVNTPARDFALQTLGALRTFVRDLGGGLIAVGGPQSYGVGGWLGTPLEETLPVEMRVQDPQRFPPLAMAIVIDKSGSMGMAEAGVSKIRLAAEAAMRVAESLNDADTLAVVAYDDRPADTFGPLQMDRRDELLAQLPRLQAGGGGIYVRESLDYAVELLRGVALEGGQQRHILLLADGADAEHQEWVLQRVAGWRDEGFTVSAVAIGEGQDVTFLQQVARAGDGRFYLTRRAADLPAIFAEDTAHAKRSYIVEETFYPAPSSSWEPLAGLDATPPLRGYVAATPKGAAQVVWEATQQDPLLAVWQYGLGRAVAWTSDATGRWAAGWVAWEEFAHFWGSVARWVLPPSTDRDVALTVEARGELAHISVDVTAPDGGYADGLQLRLQVAAPGGVELPQELALRQTAPGRYEGSFTPQGDGTSLLRLYGDRHLTAGWTSSYPAEYLPGDAGAAVAQLAARSEAAVVDDPARVFVHDLRGREAGQPLAPWLILATALLWPVDIAWRRLALSWADLRCLWQRLRSRLPRRRKQRPAVEEPPTLAARLRRRPPEERASQPVVAPPPEKRVSPGERAAQERERPASSPPPAPPRPATPADESLAAQLKERLKR
ncbi:MAG: hypothetical protein DRI37_04325, partial [Chloroflexi bacterium]